MATYTGEKGTYTVSGQPFEGGQAEVWLGEDEAGQLVAVKVAHRNRRLARSVVEEVSAMLDIAGRVVDPARWLVPVLDVGETADGTPFYVMPRIDRTLDDFLTKDVPLLQRLDALAQACHAIERLHGASTPTSVVVHRDVKPSNFLVRLVDGRPEVHIADFGGLRDAALMSTETQTLILSPHYAPPEQYLPLKTEPDPSQDIFALAAVVFEGVTTKSPPEASVEARGWHNRQALDLFKLAVRRRRLEADEQVKFEKLRALPIHQLIVDPPHDTVLPGEKDKIAEAVAYGLRDLDPDVVDAAVQTALSALVPVLERGLQPDPRLRLASAAPLRRACVEVHDKIAKIAGVRTWSLADVFADGGTIIPTDFDAPAAAGPGGGRTAVPQPTHPTLQPMTGGVQAADMAGAVRPKRVRSGPTLDFDGVGSGQTAVPSSTLDPAEVARGGGGTLDPTEVAAAHRAPAEVAEPEERRRSVLPLVLVGLLVAGSAVAGGAYLALSGAGSTPADDGLVELPVDEGMAADVQPADEGGAGQAAGGDAPEGAATVAAPAGVGAATAGAGAPSADEAAAEEPTRGAAVAPTPTPSERPAAAASAPDPAEPDDEDDGAVGAAVAAPVVAGAGAGAAAAGNTADGGADAAETPAEAPSAVSSAQQRAQQALEAAGMGDVLGGGGSAAAGTAAASVSISASVVLAAQPGATFTWNGKAPGGRMTLEQGTHTLAVTSSWGTKTYQVKVDKYGPGVKVTLTGEGQNQVFTGRDGARVEFRGGPTGRWNVWGG